MLHKIEKLFTEQVRPALAAHGGNIEIIDLDNHKLFVKLIGGCQGCSSSKVTLQEGIVRLIKQNFPDITEVIDVTDHTTGENPYYK